MTYRETYEAGKGVLAAAGIDEAELNARLLLEHVCGTDRNTLLIHGDRAVSEEERGEYERLIERRAQRIPLQHLTGVQNFMGLDFSVNGQVLIPRQDTEILVEEVPKNTHDGMRILDMCTGSGCILISLLSFTNDCEGVGADLSAEALKVAAANADRLLGVSGWDDGTDDAAEGRNRWKLIQSDLFGNVEGTFDIIVSNPPYIRSEIIETLMPEVRDHEPRMALDGDEDGLLFYRRIVGECGAHLAGGGMLFFEIGYDQAAAVAELLEAAGFLEIRVVKDYAGLDRVVYGTKSFAGM